ncbi:MAG: hypothetical protein U9R26_10405 [Campylobacterota bacterium]|nr:hypothetical protein [Campylobacterota bacterium]
MDFKKSRTVMSEAINSGCRTMGELALYLKLIREIKAACPDQYHKSLMPLS